MCVAEGEGLHLASLPTVECPLSHKSLVLRPATGSCPGTFPQQRHPPRHDSDSQTVHSASTDMHLAKSPPSLTWTGLLQKLAVCALPTPTATLQGGIGISDQGDRTRCCSTYIWVLSVAPARMKVPRSLGLCIFLSLSMSRACGTVAGLYAHPVNSYGALGNSLLAVAFAKEE